MKITFHASIIICAILIDFRSTFSASLKKGSPCKQTNETFTLRNESYCVDLENEAHIYIKQLETQVYYHHRLWSNEYTFYFPEVSLKCECTCIFDGTVYCSEESSQNENECNQRQTEKETCTYFDQGGDNHRVCERHQRTCCQATLAIHDHNQKYRAIQPQMWMKSIELEIDSKLHGITVMNIPEWVEKVLLWNESMIEVRYPENDKDLFEWIYYSEENEQFYAGVQMNEKSEQDLTKLGWFQTRDDGKINKIPKNVLEQQLDLTLENCVQNVTFDWNLRANNFYQSNHLMSVMKGKLLNKLYPNSRIIDKASFFNGRPAFEVRTNQLTIMELQLTNTSPVEFFAVISNNQSTKTLMLTIFRSPIDHYDVRLGFLEYRRVHQINITSKTEFPHIAEIHIQNGIEQTWMCLYSTLKHETMPCVSPKSEMPPEKPTAMRSPATSTLTSTKQPDHEADSYKLLYIMLGVLIFIVIFLGLLMLCWYGKKRKSKITQAWHTKGDTSLENAAMYRSIASETDHVPLLQLNRPIEQLKHKLRKQYQAYTMPQMTWMNKIRDVNSFDKYYIEQQLENADDFENNRKIRTLHELFVRNESEHEPLIGSSRWFPKVFLIIGKPQHGKTTLLTKIAYDWGTGKNYIVNAFDMIIHIGLNESQQDFEKLLKEHIGDENMRALSQNQEKVLLLLDDFDKIPHNQQESLLKVCKGEFCSGMTIMIACRSVPKKTKELPPFWNSVITVDGICHEHSKKVLSAYLNLPTQIQNEKLIKSVSEINVLLKCPLLFWLYAFLNKDYELKLDLNICNLREEMLNLMIHKSLVTKTMTTSELTELFQYLEKQNDNNSIADSTYFRIITLLPDYISEMQQKGCESYEPTKLLKWYKNQNTND